MGRHVAGDAPEMDRLVDDAMRGIGADIDELAIPQLWGVVLGGGYGRGEGGVRKVCGFVGSVGSGVSGLPKEDGFLPDSCNQALQRITTQTPKHPQTQTLSNDLDFYVVAREGASAADIAAIGAALAPVSAR